MSGIRKYIGIRSVQNKKMAGRQSEKQSIWALTVKHKWKYRIFPETVTSVPYYISTFGLLQ